MALGRHLQSCLDGSHEDNRHGIAEFYANALTVIGQRSIPCLKVQDAGSTGPNDARWKALVEQEGAVSKARGFLAYVSPLGRALVDKRLYLPESWTSDQER